MKDFVGVENVISEKRIRELSVRSDGPAAIRITCHWGASFFTAYLMSLTYGTWLCIPLFMLQGILLNFLYAPEHECDHFTAFKMRWINVVVARLCGFTIIFNSDYHRWTHYHHHRNTQDWEVDPEISGRGKLNSVYAYLVALLGI